MVGGLCAVGLIDWALCCFLFSIAAIIGGQFNYWMGSKIGKKMLSSNSKWFGERELKKTQDFYNTYGPSALVIARFVPFIRTFAPFVAGMGQMTFINFTIYNVLGALIWVFGVIGVGYALGNVPWVKDHIEFFIWGLLLVPSLIAVVGSYKLKSKDASK